MRIIKVLWMHRLMLTFNASWRDIWLTDCFVFYWFDMIAQMIWYDLCTEKITSRIYLVFIVHPKIEIFAHPHVISYLYKLRKEDIWKNDYKKVYTLFKYIL